MARIPPHMMKQQGAPAGAPVPVGAMVQTATALTGMLPGAAKLGNQIARFAEEQQGLKNQRDVIEQSAILDKKESDLMMKIYNDRSIDPSAWVGMYDDEFPELAQDAWSELSPVARMNMEDKYEALRGKGRIRMAERALKENKTRTSSVYSEGIKQAKIDGLPEVARSYIDQAEDSGLWSDGRILQEKNALRNYEFNTKVASLTQNGRIPDLQAEIDNIKNDRNEWHRYGPATKEKYINLFEDSIVKQESNILKAVKSDPNIQNADQFNEWYKTSGLELPESMLNNIRASYGYTKEDQLNIAAEANSILLEISQLQRNGNLTPEIQRERWSKASTLIQSISGKNDLNQIDHLNERLNQYEPGNTAITLEGQEKLIQDSWDSGMEASMIADSYGQYHPFHEKPKYDEDENIWVYPIDPDTGREYTEEGYRAREADNQKVKRELLDAYNNYRQYCEDYINKHNTITPEKIDDFKALSLKSFKEKAVKNATSPILDSEANMREQVAPVFGLGNFNTTAEEAPKAIPKAVVVEEEPTIIPAGDYLELPGVLPAKR